MNNRVDEALAAELAYRRERLLAQPRHGGTPRYRWLPRRHRQEG